MPIIEPVSEDLPLSQGDVLRSIRLFSTKECWTSEGGQHAVSNHQLCMVVSRPCVAQHKAQVTALAIEQYRNGIPGDVKSVVANLAMLGMSYVTLLMNEVLDLATKDMEGEGR